MASESAAATVNPGFLAKPRAAYCKSSRNSFIDWQPLSHRSSQQRLQILPVSTARWQILFVRQSHDELTAVARPHLLDAVHVYDDRPMNANELLSRKFLLDFPHGAPRQVRSLSHMQTHVIRGRFQPVDLRQPQKQQPALGLDHQAILLAALL